jgi:hypothetical protein
MVMRDSPVNCITWGILRNFIAVIPVTYQGVSRRNTRNHQTAVKKSHHQLFRNFAPKLKRIVDAK